MEQVCSNKDATKGRDEDLNAKRHLPELFAVFLLQIFCRFLAGLLQVVYRLFADREPYLDLSSDFMPLALNICGSKKKMSNGWT